MSTPTVWGEGERVVLVHGSLATGPEEWLEQRPLADEGFELVVPTRRAYASPGPGEDFLSDGEDVARLLGDGAHLVGHSYGGLVALVASHLRPTAVRSLVLAEPPLFAAAADHPAVAGLVESLQTLLSSDVDDRAFLGQFLRHVGTPEEELPAELLARLETMVPALRHARHPWQGEVPLTHLAAAPFPTVVVSGRHDEPFHAVCLALARDHGAQLRVVEGAGHEVQLTGEPFNAVLRDL
ncbi:Pimeloyl-ACP methyl ester carboxylesterase [Georgenia satyanarayanai]|uniref:Pimeloyl-ACP methyl ester carboxylesterase n=1 Tax=Georgenia satyanarayanai TaxID=860221 RepID=A0A2Y9ADX8_9MICO|nr:alpha/beta hydrolase [Georgenia satyanarayanai]PYF99540.1 pimeloyl-ACP methyl ester carboxylesterase [Georgenia satyanarayanai]SSA42385.1 Pimeloyl-ACP methyl ester carboxylesterase [Georgenia satyanarayanai]